MPPRCPESDSRAKRDQASSEVCSGSISGVSGIGDRRVRVGCRAPDNSRIVAWDVNHLRIRRLYLDYCFIFYHPRFNCLLGTGFELPRILCLHAQALNSVHDITLLSKECVSQICGPLDVLTELFDYVWKCDQGLNTGIPALFLYCFDQSFTF